MRAPHSRDDRRACRVLVGMGATGLYRIAVSTEFIVLETVADAYMGTMRESHWNCRQRSRVPSSVTCAPSLPRSRYDQGRWDREYAALIEAALQRQTTADRHQGDVRADEGSGVRSIRSSDRMAVVAAQRPNR